MNGRLAKAGALRYVTTSIYLPNNKYVQALPFNANRRALWMYSASTDLYILLQDGPATPSDIPSGTMANALKWEYDIRTWYEQFVAMPPTNPITFLQGAFAVDTIILMEGFLP